MIHLNELFINNFRSIDLCLSAFRLVMNVWVFYLLLKFHSNTLEMKETSKGTIATVGIIYAVGLFGGNTLEIPLLNTGLAFILSLTVSIALFYGRTIKKLCFSVMFVNMCIAAELLITYMYLFFDISHLHPNIQFLIGSFVSKVMIYALIVLLKKLFPYQNKRSDWANQADILINLSLFPFLSLLTMNVILYISKQLHLSFVLNISIVILMVGMLFVSIWLFFIYDNIMKKREMEMELETNQKMAVISERLYREQQNNIQRARREAHDFKNHLLQIHMLYKTNDPSADTYHSTLIHSLDEQISQYLIDVNNIVIANMIGYLKSACKQNGIKLDMEITYTDLSLLEATDANRLFGNLFDNALYASMEVENHESWIYLRILRHSNYLLITLSNAYCTPVQKANNQILSSKRSYKSSGYGLLNIAEVAEKYGGDVIYDYTNDTFTVTVRLQIVQ